MKTHPAITHPALRHRIAQALNQLRHESPFWLSHQLFGKHKGKVAIHRYWSGRQALRIMAERMAALEQALDTEQEARLFGPQPAPDDYRIANRPDNPNWHGVANWFDNAAGLDPDSQSELRQMQDWLDE